MTIQANYSPQEKVPLRDVGLSFLALLVLVGVFFFPRLSIGGGASLRLEDVASVFILISLLLNLALRKLVLTKWMVLAIIYFSYIFLVSMIRYVAGESTLGFMLFLGKEFQYFCFALVFYYLVVKGHERFIWNVALLLSVLVAFWGGWQLITGQIDYYGIGAPFIIASPSLSGQVYWFSTVIILSFLLLHKVSPIKTNFLYLIAALDALSCLATISRSSGFGLFVFLSFFLAGRYFFIAKKCLRVNTLLLRGLFVIIGVLLLVFLVSDSSDIFSKLSRYDSVIGSIQSRNAENWSVRIQLLQSPIDVLVGLGAGVAHMQNGLMVYGMAYDSQYMRNILVLGVLGSLLWVLMLAGFAWRMRLNKKVLIIYLALLASFLVSGVGFESFNLSKSGTFFWLMTGILFGIIRKNARLRAGGINVLAVRRYL